MTALKKLEATRRDFVANVSHELRTPLTAIRGYAETLRAGALADAEQADQFLAIIARHSERLTRLTDDLLTLSDLELGRAPIQAVPMALARAVEAAIDVVRDKAVQAGVELRCELPPDLPLLKADPDRFEQVLLTQEYEQGLEELLFSLSCHQTAAKLAEHRGIKPWIIHFQRQRIFPVDPSAYCLSGLPIRQPFGKLQHRYQREEPWGERRLAIVRK